MEASVVPSQNRPSRAQEPIDELLQVTTKKAWLALLALGLALSSVLAWSIFGTVPVTVAGTGIIQLHEEGTRAVVAQGSGLLTHVAVAPGQDVKAGQAIAELAMPDLEQQIRAARKSLENITVERGQIDRFFQGYLAAQKKVTGEQFATYRKLGRDAAELADANRIMFESMNKLHKDGFATLSQVESARERYMSATQTQDQAVVNGLQAMAQQRALINQRDEALRQNGDRLIEARGQLDRLSAAAETGGKIKSPVAGRVLQVETQLHTMIASGTTVALIEVGQRRPSAIVYVPAAAGKRIQAGMRVEVSPTTVKPEQYGSIVGKVRWIGNYPATPAEMMRVLNNQALVNTFAATGPALEVIVDLSESKSAPSGFQWASMGPSLQITSGTIATGRITVESDAPITLVIPFFKWLFGL